MVKGYTYILFREFYIVARLVQLMLPIYFGVLYLFYCIYCALLGINTLYCMIYFWLVKQNNLLLHISHKKLGKNCFIARTILTK